MDRLAMDRTPKPRRPAPPVMELLEPPRGLGIPIDELIAVIDAIDDRAEYAASVEQRAVLRRAGCRLERELGRLLAADA